MAPSDKSPGEQWRPGAGLRALKMRAELYSRIRHFFAQREVLEVDVPLMGGSTVSDPHIESISVNYQDSKVSTAYFLQTSPEYFMKRLLSAGSGAIYALTKAFRNGEAGNRHNPEFTMLEWYRPDFDDHALMDEVEALLRDLLPLDDVRRVSYGDIFQECLAVDPHRASLDELQALAKKHIDVHWQDDDRDVWLDLLMTHCVEPQLGEGLVFIYDYPESQAALAKVQNDDSGNRVARRFEAYVSGLELVNGYWELTDAAEQARRFQADIEKRQTLGLPLYPLDNKLLSALESGMPASAGVALGVDRLLMLMGAGEAISDVIAFPFDRL
jgi:lysyl-tRNA synthetase class 2